MRKSPKETSEKWCFRHRRLPMSGGDDWVTDKALTSMFAPPPPPPNRLQ